MWHVLGAIVGQMLLLIDVTSHLRDPTVSFKEFNSLIMLEWATFVYTLPVTLAAHARRGLYIYVFDAKPLR